MTSGITLWKKVRIIRLKTRHSFGTSNNNSNKSNKSSALTKTTAQLQQHRFFRNFNFSKKAKPKKNNNNNYSCEDCENKINEDDSEIHQVTALEENETASIINGDTLDTAAVHPAPTSCCKPRKEKGENNVGEKANAKIAIKTTRQITMLEGMLVNKAVIYEKEKTNFGEYHLRNPITGTSENSTVATAIMGKKVKKVEVTNGEQMKLKEEDCSGCSASNQVLRTHDVVSVFNKNATNTEEQKAHNIALQVTASTNRINNNDNWKNRNPNGKQISPTSVSLVQNAENKSEEEQEKCSNNDNGNDRQQETTDAPTSTVPFIVLLDSNTKSHANTKGNQLQNNNISKTTEMQYENIIKNVDKSNGNGNDKFPEGYGEKKEAKKEKQSTIALKEQEYRQLRNEVISNFKRLNIVLPLPMAGLPQWDATMRIGVATSIGSTTTHNGHSNEKTLDKRQSSNNTIQIAKKSQSTLNHLSPMHSNEEMDSINYELDSTDTMIKLSDKSTLASISTSTITSGSSISSTSSMKECNNEFKKINGNTGRVICKYGGNNNDDNDDIEYQNVLKNNPTSNPCFKDDQYNKTDDKRPCCRSSLNNIQKLNLAINQMEEEMATFVEPSKLEALKHLASSTTAISASKRCN